MGDERYKWKWVMYPDLRFQQKYNVTSTLVWNEGQNWMEDKESCISEGLVNEPPPINRIGGPDLIVTVWDGLFISEFAPLIDLAIN
jgi:hypothetical protein